MKSEFIFYNTTNLPGQEIKHIEYDLKKAYSYNINQISIYPLMVFPLTNLEKIIKQSNLKRFSELQERKIFKIIDNISRENGVERTSIWTYNKKSSSRYTSVTRESFIGFGAGASSLFSNYFYLNTFNVDEYIKTVNQGKYPINIVNVMNQKERMVFGLFWRCYDGVISQSRFREIFNKNMETEFKLLFKLLKIFKLAEKQGECYILTERGMFVYHYIEKQYSIYYLNNLWQKSMESAWIDEIKL